MGGRARCGTALVLAGGRGTRLAPAVDDRAKILAEVDGRPFLTHLLDRLANGGCARVVLCTGHRGDEVRSLVGARYRGLTIGYSHEDTVAGTGGALRLAAERLEDERLLVLNGDSLCDVDLGAVWARHCSRAPAATMVVAEVPDAGRFGQVEIDEAGRIRAFREKTGEARPGWINAGIYVVGRTRLLAIDAGCAVSLETEVLPTWVAAGMEAFPARGCFVDIGTPRAYATAAEDLRGGTSADDLDHDVREGAP